MAATVTPEALRELAAFHSEDGCAISVYVDLDPSATPTIPDVQAKFSALLAEAEKLVDGADASRERRLSLRRSLARIREWWSRDFRRDGMRALALFSAPDDGLFRPLPLPERAGDAVRIGRELYIAPLASHIGRGEGALVAVVNRERGTLYRLSGGRLVEVADETEEQPGRHDQGGWSQANYQRHIEKLVHEHLRTVGDEVGKQVRRGGQLEMVIVAPEEMRGEFEAELSQQARDAIVGWASAEAHAGPSELLEVVRPLLDEARARREEAALNQFRDGLGRGGRAAAGWEEVLELAADRRVAVLFLTEGATARAWRCPRCDRPAASPRSCPVDGIEMEEHGDAADLAVHQVAAHGGRVVSLGAGALADAGDVGALLFF